MYLTFRYVIAYFEQTIGNKYSTLVTTNESKEKIQKYEELLRKIRDLIRLKTKKSDNYDKKYIKIKFNSDDELPLNKMIEIPTMTIVFRAIFHENNKCFLRTMLV